MNLSIESLSPLKGAIRFGCLKMVKYLVEKGADLNKVNFIITYISA